MDVRRRQRFLLWVAALAIFFNLTAFLLPCVPCPPEAHGLAAPRGCLDCGGEERVTAAEWLRYKAGAWRR